MSHTNETLLEAIQAEIERHPASPVTLTVGELRQLYLMYKHEVQQREALSNLVSTSTTTPEPANCPDSILLEAQGLVTGPRQAAYGHSYYNFTRVATGWETIFDKTAGSITPEKVGLALMWLKMARQLHKPSRENMVDAAGYAKLTHDCVEFDPHNQPA